MGTLQSWTKNGFTDFAVWSNGSLNFLYPNLGKLAKFLFGIKINSASVERLFSAYGLIKTKRRANLADNKMFKLGTIRYSQLEKQKRTKQCSLPVLREYSIPDDEAVPDHIKSLVESLGRDVVLENQEEDEEGL